MRDGRIEKPGRPWLKQGDPELALMDHDVFRVTRQEASRITSPPSGPFVGPRTIKEIRNG
jgi:hypothetical protein